MRKVDGAKGERYLAEAESPQSLNEAAGHLKTQNRSIEAGLLQRPSWNYLRSRLKLTKRPTRASQPKTSNSRRSWRSMEGGADILGVEWFVGVLSPFRPTTFSLGSVSQVSTGTLCVFVVISIHNASALLAWKLA